jgi:diacylglycerol kinase family enzyme
MRQRITAIINSSSGTPSDDEAHKRLKAVLKSKGLDWEIKMARSGAEILALGREAARNQNEVVVAGGGDGTINCVASSLLGSKKIFGVLPFGTLNHFAKDLEIPLELERAVDNIAGGRVVAVDVGEVNGRFFLNNSSIGIYPKIVDRREAQQKQAGRSKWLALFSAATRTLRRYTAFRVRVSADQRRFTRKTPVVFVGNNEYEIQGISLGTRECLDGGTLCLYVLHDSGPWGLAKLSARAVVGKTWKATEFDAVKTQEVCIETRRRSLRVALDGEVYDMKTPLLYRIHPAALKVIVPAINKEDQ